MRRDKRDVWRNIFAASRLPWKRRARHERRRQRGSACGQLHEYVELIPPAVHKALGEKQTADLRENLRKALYVRGLDPSAEGLDQLLEAAGSFIALADFEASS